MIQVPPVIARNLRTIGAVVSSTAMRREVEYTTLADMLNMSEEDFDRLLVGKNGDLTVVDLYRLGAALDVGIQMRLVPSDANGRPATPTEVITNRVSAAPQPAPVTADPVPSLPSSDSPPPVASPVASPMRGPLLPPAVADIVEPTTMTSSPPFLPSSGVGRVEPTLRTPFHETPGDRRNSAMEALAESVVSTGISPL